MKQRADERYRVYITHDTLRGLMLEKSRHPGLECIIQMPGRRIGNDFFYDQVADSGMHATYEYAMCEKDHEYCDHLSTIIADYYDFPYDQLVVAQVHYHPKGYDRFSPGDGPANKKLAQQFGGVTNGLMWIDPNFHMQFWYIDEEGNETAAQCVLDDEQVAQVMPKKSLEKLKKQIEDNESRTFIRVRKSPYKDETYHNSENDLDMKKNIISKEITDEESEYSLLNTFTTFIKNLFMGEEEKNMNNPFEPENPPGVYCSTETEIEIEKNMTEADISLESLMDSLRNYTVLMPLEYKTQKYEGVLRGYYIPDTKTFNIVTEKLIEARNDTVIVGSASCDPDCETETDTEIPSIRVIWTDDEPLISVLQNADAEIVVDYYALNKEVFSRNTGILEASQMAKRQAVIPGLGSGGFFVGLELVKAGIGSLIVADDDVFAYHNICRHVCGIHDVGKYKADIFKERAADINPNCKVYAFRDLIQHVDPQLLEELIWEKSIIVCCTDNRHAGYVCNELADKYHIPMVDAGCGPRASTGEVFYYKPDSGMACYTCAYGEDIGVDHGNQTVRRKFYATESELEKLHFQPGMSLDIETTAIFETKIAIDLLMDGEEGYVPKLLPYIRQCTLILNYPVDKDVNPYMQLFENDKQGMRPMTWKSGSAVKNTACSYCKVQDL